MEQIPGALAQLEKLFSLRALRLGAVATFAERASPLGGASVAKRRAGSLFVLGACAAPATAPAGIGEGPRDSVVRGRRGGWLMGLALLIVHELGEQLRSSASQLLLCFFGRFVFPWATRSGSLRSLRR